MRFKPGTYVYVRRFKKLMKLMSDELDWELRILDELERRTFKELEDRFVPQDQWNYYMGFQKRVWERRVHFAQATYQLEKQSLLNEYVLRGWDLSTLQAIQYIAENMAIYKLMNYLYAGVWTYPGKIVSVDLSKFAKVSTLTLDPGENLVYSLIVVGGYLYAGLATSPGKIVKIDLATGKKISTLTLGANEDSISSLVTGDGFLYAGSDLIGGRVIKIDLSTFTKVATIWMGAGKGATSSLAIEYGWLYSGHYGSPYVACIDLATFTKVADILLGMSVRCLVISGDYLYVGCMTTPGAIAKINLVTWTYEDLLILSSGENLVYSLAVDDGYLYAGLYVSPGKVVKIDLASFSEVATLTLSSGENLVRALVIVGDHLYAGLATSPGKIVKIDLAKFAVDETLTLDVGENTVYSLCHA